MVPVRLRWPRRRPVTTPLKQRTPFHRGAAQGEELLGESLSQEEREGLGFWKDDLRRIRASASARERERQGRERRRRRKRRTAAMDEEGPAAVGGEGGGDFVYLWKGGEEEALEGRALEDLHSGEIDFVFVF